MRRIAVANYVKLTNCKVMMQVWLPGRVCVLCGTTLLLCSIHTSLLCRTVHEMKGMTSLKACIKHKPACFQVLASGGGQ